MESETVFSHLDYLGSSGIVFSVEQKASLQSSLVTLKREHKFRRVKLWGIIRGIQNDYFIVQGVGKDEIKDRKALFRYACKQIVWHERRCRCNTLLLVYFCVFQPRLYSVVFITLCRPGTEDQILPASRKVHR